MADGPLDSGFWGRGLSARLLLLTIVFVMIAEFLIYAPSISRYRKSYIEQMLSEAHLAALALEATADAMVSDDLENELLQGAGAYAIALSRPERRLLALSKDMPPKVDLTFDLRDTMMVSWLPAAFDTLFQDSNRVLRVIAPSPKDPNVVVEVVMDETPMRLAMYGYSTRILQLSIVISLITAGAVYLSLQLLLVRPMRRIIGSMVKFQEDPEDESRIMVPGDRTDELGLAERQLAVMQRDVRNALRQKSRLATLGAAVAKVNHDLRNSLATAMLVHDRLANLEDPEVQKITPRLYTAIDRAVNMCSQTLSYVGDDRPEIERFPVELHHLVEQVAEVMRSFGEDMPELKPLAEMAWRIEIDPALRLDADPAQLMRILENLARNSALAGATTLTVSAERRNGATVVDIADDGPGLPQKALDKLFQPFVGSARAGGTGLGLVIVRDVMRAHGGSVTLARSDQTGATFRLEFPHPGN